MSGKPVVLPAAEMQADVVIATEWNHLLLSGPDIIPLSFGQLNCQTDASISLLLDQVTHARLGIEALGLVEALRCLRRERDTLDLRAPMTALRTPTVPLTEVMDCLRTATKVGGSRKPSLPERWKKTRLKRLKMLRNWIVKDRSYVPGLTVHQAKGKEWSTVDIALDASAQQALANGLDPTNELHRKIYVGLTRGINATRLRSL